INGVISAATIEAKNRGKEVIGITDGFKWISKGDTSKVISLDISNTSRIHTTGGSMIGVSRQSPLKDEDSFQNTVNSIKKLGIKYLITIGGDGTMFLAKTLNQHFKGKVKIAHVPKTIDNNISLPDYIPTFGFETALDVGTKIINSIMEDAKTTSRWFIIVTMGRETGHLALGIAKAAGATLAVIPEEFKEKKVSLHKMIKILEGSIIKRLSMGRAYGVAIVAEGMLDIIDPVELGVVDKDNMGRIRYIDVNFGQLLKNELYANLQSKGIDTEIINKRIGYELRSAPPIPYDLKYTRNLGYCAVKYLLDGGDCALISMKNGKMNPIKFEKLIDRKTGKIKIRYVDLNTESYEVSQKYMIKLQKTDLDNSKILKKLTAETSLSKMEFKQYFSGIFI
ncbi:MAG: 6-phosphofructokinase, partial [Thermodesulfobacteriota bacterium]